MLPFPRFCVGLNSGNRFIFTKVTILDNPLVGLSCWLVARRAKWLYTCTHLSAEEITGEAYVNRSVRGRYGEW